jgi:hypothetical protein
MQENTGWRSDWKPRKSDEVRAARKAARERYKHNAQVYYMRKFGLAIPGATKYEIVGAGHTIELTLLFQPSQNPPLATNQSRRDNNFHNKKLTHNTRLTCVNHLISIQLQQRGKWRAEAG